MLAKLCLIQGRMPTGIGEPATQTLETHIRIQGRNYQSNMRALNK